MATLRQDLAFSCGGVDRRGLHRDTRILGAMVGIGAALAGLLRYGRQTRIDKSIGTSWFRAINAQMRIA